MIGKVISHYKILERLGGGGMGIVYKAEDLKLNRIVALKFLPPELSRDTESKKRFIHEARAASALQHNNICTIHEIDETEDGQMYICMDYYAGETLKNKIEDAIEISVQIANGLASAHEVKEIHRDIKPANIMITEKGDVKIVDFGLARLTGQSRLTVDGATLGTIAYMSPEQARGEEVDHQTDIWSLGIVLYELITGELPFKGEHEQAILYSIINESPETLTGNRIGVPLELERIVNKMLAKNPAERYKHINDVLVDLTALKSIKTKNQNTVHPIGEVTIKRRKPIIYFSVLGIFIIFIAAAILIIMKRSDSIDSLAILPFENVFHNEELEYLCEGIPIHIINIFPQYLN
jgi:serine/threonine protein kinase